MSVAPLNLAWGTQTHARATSSALGEPDWLTADRLAALERVAELLRTGRRDYDVVARLANDEYAILLPGADAVAAAQIRHQRTAIGCLPLAQLLGDVRYQRGDAVGEVEGRLVGEHGLGGGGKDGELRDQVLGCHTHRQYFLAPT